MLTIAEHPLLALRAFETQFSAPLEAVPTPPWLTELFAPGTSAPLTADDAIRSAIRTLLRHGGYKPTGRGKPASEYLARAAAEGALGAINLAVDAGNAVSLHSGLPISVVDLDRVQQPLKIEIAPAGASYVFNNAGHSIDLEGLLCLFDAEGPCANAVKDSMRTKTGPQTRRTLSLLWGVRVDESRLERATAWYRELLERAGAQTRPFA